MTTSASIYARLSQDKRKGTDEEGLSVEQQVKVCTEWIKHQGWTVGTVYKDNNVSATSGALRPEFERMLADAPSRVVFWKQDRLERGYNGDLDRFLLSGIDGYGVDGSRVTLETASSEFMTRIQSLMGKHEQRMKSERIRLANQRIASAGKYRGSIRPFGQERDGTHVEVEALAVREAVKGILESGWSFFKVSEMWNQAGLKTPQTGKQGGREWTSGTVRQYFQRPRLYGYQEYKGTLFALRNWEPLLTKDEFDAIQIKIAQKSVGFRKSPVRHDIHLLTNLAKCSDCGRGLNAGYRGGAGSPRIYRCPTTKHLSITAEPLDEAVTNHALQLLSQHTEVQQQITASVTERLALEKKRHELLAEYDAWVSEAVESRLSPRLLAAKEQSYRRELQDIDAGLLSLEGEKLLSIFEFEAVPMDTPMLRNGNVDWARAVQNARNNFTGWNQTDIEFRRELLSTLFTQISISRGGQGRRFDAHRSVSYAYTELGERLYTAWMESELHIEE